MLMGCCLSCEEPPDGVLLAEYNPATAVDYTERLIQPTYQEMGREKLPDSSLPYIPPPLPNMSFN